MSVGVTTPAAGGRGVQPPNLALRQRVDPVTRWNVSKPSFSSGTTGSVQHLPDFSAARMTGIGLISPSMGQ